MEKKYPILVLALSVGMVIGLARPVFAQKASWPIYEQIPLYRPWLTPGFVHPKLLDSTFAGSAIDTVQDQVLRYVLYGEAGFSEAEDLYLSSLCLDTSLHDRILFFDTNYDKVIRNGIYASRWGVDPCQPFSQVRNMMSLEHIRDTLLLRKRRGAPLGCLKVLPQEFKAEAIKDVATVKRQRKPLINPKDSVSRWAFDFTGGINLAQTSLTHWSAGGESSISGNGLVDMKLSYRQGGHKWETRLNTEYGLVYTKSDGLNKTVDNLLISSQYGYAIPGGRFFYTVMMDFQTQYDRGYSEADDKKNGVPRISNFLAPGYLNVSFGMEYKLGGLLSAYFSPASSRTTFVEDQFLADQGLFGVDTGQNVKFEVGMSLKAALDWTFWKNMTLKTDATFFTPYNSDFGNIVVDWNVQIEMQVNSVFKAMIGTSLKYDDNVRWVDSEGIDRGPKVQFREMITVGIGYTFAYKSKRMAAE